MASGRGAQLVDAGGQLQPAAFEPLDVLVDRLQALAGLGDLLGRERGVGEGRLQLVAFGEQHAEPVVGQREFLLQRFDLVGAGLPRGGVEPFDGDLDDYQRWLLERSREAAREEARRDTAAVDRKQERRAAAEARQARADRIKPLRKELNRTDNRLGVLFSERDALEASFAAADLAPEQVAENGRRLKAVVDEIETLEARWLDLSTQIDALEAE